MSAASVALWQRRGAAPGSFRRPIAAVYCRSASIRFLGMQKLDLAKLQAAFDGV